MFQSYLNTPTLLPPPKSHLTFLCCNLSLALETQSGSIATDSDFGSKLLVLFQNVVLTPMPMVSEPMCFSVRFTKSSVLNK